VSIPEDFLRKIDAFWLKDLEFKAACKALHKVKELECLMDVASTTAPTFRALEERAAAWRKQESEKDKLKLEQLKKSAEVELSFVTEKMAECRQRKAKLTAQLDELTKQSESLKADALNLALDANADIANVQLKRRHVISAISEKKGEIASLDNSISDHEGNTRALKKLAEKTQLTGKRSRDE